MTEAAQNPDGTWTVTVIKDGKPIAQQLRLDLPLDQAGHWPEVDDAADTSHNHIKTMRLINEHCKEVSLQ